MSNDYEVVVLNGRTIELELSPFSGKWGYSFEENGRRWFDNGYVSKDDALRVAATAKTS